MKRKIISIAIISMFLLTGLSAVSAINIIEPKVETQEELPDLKISIRSEKNGEIIVTMDNDADVPAIWDPCAHGENIATLDVYFIVNIQGKEVEIDRGSETLAWYKKEGIPAHWHQEVKVDWLPNIKGYKIKCVAWIDGKYINWIEESNETNNNDEIIIQSQFLAKSRVPNNILLRIFNVFPILQRLLNL